MTNSTIQTYKVSVDGHSVISYEGPDGGTHSLDASRAIPGEWQFTLDSDDKPVIGLLITPGEDGTLLLSLEGAPSLAATLLHEEDDYPREYYFATDQGNNNELNRWAFILRSPHQEGSPVRPWSNFRLLCVQ